MVTVHPNLHDLSDVGAMRGPTVEMQASGDRVSVVVGHEFGKTALTPAEWADLAAQRGDKPYVLVDLGGPNGVAVSPLRTYVEAIAEFRRDLCRSDLNYDPSSHRQLMVMSRDDFLMARADGRL